MTKRMRKICAAASFAAICFVGCSSSPEGTILTRAELGDEWPFTVDKITIRCINGSFIVFDVEGQGTYALNGSARMYGKSQKTGWKEIDPIWRPDPVNPKDLKVSVGKVMERGQLLCE